MCVRAERNPEKQIEREKEREQTWRNSVTSIVNNIIICRFGDASLADRTKVALCLTSIILILYKNNTNEFIVLFLFQCKFYRSIAAFHASRFS